MDLNISGSSLPLPHPEAVATLVAPTPARKRRRPALSCAECRRRKIKCDRNIPCGQCTQSKSTTCTYSPESFSARNAANSRVGVQRSPPGAVADSSVLGGPTDIPTERVSTSTSTPKKANPSPLPSPPVPGSLSDGHSVTSRLENPGASYQTRQDPGHVEELVQRVQKLEQLLASASIVDDDHGSPHVSRVVPAKELRGNMSKSRFYGQSHWMQAFAQVFRSNGL